MRSSRRSINTSARACVGWREGTVYAVILPGFSPTRPPRAAPQWRIFSDVFEYVMNL